MQKCLTKEFQKCLCYAATQSVSDSTCPLILKINLRCLIFAPTALNELKVRGSTLLGTLVFRQGGCSMRQADRKEGQIYSNRYFNTKIVEEVSQENESWRQKRKQSGEVEGGESDSSYC